MAKRPDRVEYLYYPKDSSLDAIPSLLVKKTFYLDNIQSLEAIEHTRIGFGLGAFIPPNIRKANLNFDLISGINWQMQNIKKLMLGRIDAMFDPQDIVLKYLARQYGVTDHTKVIKFPVEKMRHLSR